ncbi:hypothetical protein [Brevundimonas lenta]|uniref:Uncharacterized protein n=1 Tax=Brevundimonas lenta TaxID=424796 RepID=A0A7W6JAW1_9CAUL|nr:hypothetical protein [Brevundimonas lenta]MBB4081756.1 hypothetical protein [Brevundimonas lenta]
MTTATLTFDAPVRRAATVPVCAGRVLTLAGAVFGSANLVQWGVVSGALGWHPAALAVTWPVAVALFFTVLFRLRRSGGEAARRVAGWSRLAILSAVTIALAFAGLSAATGDWSLMRWAAGSSLALYAVAWSVAGIQTARPNMGILAMLALAGLAAMALRLGTPDQYLIQAATLGLVALLPGLWLAFGRRL